MKCPRVRDGALAVGGVVDLLSLQAHLLEVASQHARRPPRAQRHRQKVSLPHMAPCQPLETSNHLRKAAVSTSAQLSQGLQHWFRVLLLASGSLNGVAQTHCLSTPALNIM